MPPIINEDLCTRCGMCAAICPMHLFKHEKGQVPVVAYPEECWHCNACVLDCRPGPFPSPFRFPACCCMWTHRH